MRFYPRLEECASRTTRCGYSLGPGTSDSKVRVLIESRDAQRSWGTVGVAHDIIEASWQALVDSVNFKLFKDEQRTKG